jgi:hypothetical protein
MWMHRMSFKKLAEFVAGRFAANRSPWTLCTAVPIALSDTPDDLPVTQLMQIALVETACTHALVHSYAALNC